MTGGAFQTSREIFENPIWMDAAKFRIFFYIYGNAVFAKEGTTVAGIHLKRGQFLRSYRNLRKDVGYVEKRAFKTYSLSTIKDKIERLVKEERIKTESTEYGTLFTVVNYDEYQGFERYSNPISEQQANTNRTATERQPNNNKKVNKDNNSDVDFKSLFEYFNLKSGKHFKNVESNRKLVRARLNDGYSKADIKRVIDIKSAEWRNDPDHYQYLQPSTLFAPSHFDNYLNQGFPEPQGLRKQRGFAERERTATDAAAEQAADLERLEEEAKRRLNE